MSKIFPKVIFNFILILQLRACLVDCNKHCNVIVIPMV